MSTFEVRDMYPIVDKRNCVFPFICQNNICNDCTTDGDSRKDTMIFEASDHAIPISINVTEKQEILDKFDQFHANVPSRYMLKLYLDDELAKFAQVNSNMCAPNHDQAKNRLSPLFGCNIICDYNIGEYLEPAICNCKQTWVKRSIDKHNADNDNEYNNNQNNFIATPRGNKFYLHVAKKRSFNLITRKIFQNTSFRKILNAS
ncbi:unnamed protein product [Rotaria sp. Silwood1]|nr:unnamed protein product [Rotaria sp. Silwood1]CAF4742576.1 unnamed protein product [Rotaria sp. Silwood1]